MADELSETAPPKPAGATHEEKPDAASKKAAREQREAEALRENLKRRKQQARARAEKG